MKNYAIILASGSGERFGSPKQFEKINSKTILEYTVNKFENCDLIDEIIVVVNEKYIEKTKALFSSSKKVSKIIKGGKTRKESSFNGVFSISDEEANVLIHDGVRPCIENEIIQNCITSLSYYNALCTCIPSSDTVFETEDLYLAQTPQAFKLSLIKKAHALAINDNDFTDDCGLIKKYNLSKIHIIKGSTKNIKITYPFDYSIAKLILESKN